jgi:hypothetical protein
MIVRTRVALLTQIILALATMIMSTSGANGFVVERDILASTMNRRREMMGSSIKNSNVEVTISQNPMEALRNDRSVVQSSHKARALASLDVERGCYVKVYPSTKPKHYSMQMIVYPKQAEKSSMLQPHKPILASASPQ